MKVEWAWGEREMRGRWMSGREGEMGMEHERKKERDMNNEYLNEERERDRMKDK